ncbi:conserved hypothetical protein [Ferrimonas balearica DSM 9799]|uniref:DUF2986 domain-containing protein n=1 Tax=Ferrimonas balearica (strain DSM 9799 / CCM 4581 / KCTC 23876 / PAT) TaxID=550540 RepID=E1SSZ1_FERBD|nr:DUF2986 domain-containing protein [Ferrimonas balearica]ADN75047.1 conserved hypothetical protein [Ferrimonas balearica DSM 9799]MBW3137942.1 DUF2986 domain-containing protein [Ferrimonas balearica]MBY6104948.1 DUF2986 domain-containing protein [Ferrimonas balearica]MBY6224868.1 DUF2986 domain-containing protein [Ferrimonas balearica]
MNRKKKVKQTLLKQAKKARAKKATNPNKPRYISKAERAEQEAQAQANVESTPPETDSEQ